MPNKNYVKGRRKEYKICDRLKTFGFDIVQRTAGSHSPIDVIAIDKKRKIIMLIQSKPDNYDDSKVLKLYKKHGWLTDTFKVCFHVE